MYRNQWALKIFALLAVVSLIAGCNTASPVAPTTDLISVEATTGAIQTQAAGTVIANLTLNAPTATETSLPTATSEPPTATVPPTATEIAATATTEPTATIVHPTFTVGPTNTAAPSATPSSFKCSISEQSPEFGFDVKPGSDFDATWTVKNTGTDTWTTNSVDFKYISGAKMHEGNDTRDMGADVATDKTIKLVLDMIAPKDVGRHTATWGLVTGANTLCVFSVTIDVVE